jgi:hypothetical protein
VSRSRRIGDDDDGELAAFAEGAVAPAPPVGTIERVNRGRRWVEQELNLLDQLAVPNVGPKSSATTAKGKRKRTLTAKAAEVAAAAASKQPKRNTKPRAPISPTHPRPRRK